jgi:hypothetical protein
MKIQITIQDCMNNRQLDIQVDHQQRIKTTLKTIQENLNEFLYFKDIDTVRIKSSGRQVSIDMTYEEAGIYTGAILLFEVEKDEKIDD